MTSLQNSNSNLILVVGGVAGILGLLHIGDIIAIAIYDVTLPGGYYLGYLSSAVFTIGVLYGSYWVNDHKLFRNRHRRIVGWFLVGLVGFLLLNIGFMSAFPPESNFTIFAWGRWAIGFGGGIGFAIGVFEARAMSREIEAERARVRQQELQKERNQLNKFASVVSHDLRNPLNVAQGRLQLARQKCDSNELDDVEQSLSRMENMITDILTLARTGGEIEDPQEVDLDTFAKKCWESVETADATLNLEVKQTIFADKDRLKRVFENLIRNAVEHGGEDVAITVGGLGNGFFIEDDGQGIPKERQEEVFEMGYSSSETGTGFGLAITKEIIEAHGWEIEIEQGSEGGARFEITNVDLLDEY